MKKDIFSKYKFLFAFVLLFISIGIIDALTPLWSIVDNSSPVQTYFAVAMIAISIFCAYAIPVIIKKESRHRTILIPLFSIILMGSAVLLMQYVTSRRVGFYHPDEVMEEYQALYILRTKNLHLVYNPSDNVFIYDKTKVSRADIESAIEEVRALEEAEAAAPGGSRVRVPGKSQR